MATFTVEFAIVGSLRESNGTVHSLNEISDVRRTWAVARAQAKGGGPTLEVEFLDSVVEGNTATFTLAGHVKYSAEGRSQLGYAQELVKSLAHAIAKQVRQNLEVQLGNIKSTVLKPV